MMAEARTRRVNVVIGEQQYTELQRRNLNISGLLRDLIGDYLSGQTITLQVGRETRQLYETIVANTAFTDEDIETHLRGALATLLRRQIESLEELYRATTAESKEGSTSQSEQTSPSKS